MCILSLIFENFQSVIESEMGFYFHSGPGAWPLLGQGLAWLDECGAEVADDDFFGGDIEEEEFWGRGWVDGLAVKKIALRDGF